MLASEESFVRRKRRWVWCLQHNMFFCIDQCSFASCKISSQQKDHSLFVIRDRLNHCIGKTLSWDMLMWCWLSCSHGQDRIEKQYSLLGPRFQISTLRNFSSYIVADLFVNIYERWRRLHSIWHRKTQPMRLSFTMIRVLSQNHDLHLIERRQFKRIEDLPSCWIDHLPLCFLIKQRLLDLLKIWLIELISEHGLSRWMEFERHPPTLPIQQKTANKKIPPEFWEDDRRLLVFHKKRLV